LEKNKIKFLLIFLVGFFVFMSLPLSGLSTGIGDILVGSDITENSYLKLEMFLYKADDQHPNYDYYLVELNMFERGYGNDIYVGIWDSRAYSECEASYGNVDCLETFREPDPGLYVLETPGTINFYGFLLDIWLPAGAVSFWFDGGEEKPCWRVDAVMGGFGSVPATREQADFAIGFRVSQDAHVSIRGNCWAKWYRWFLIFLVGVTEGWGSECYIYH
jgi:hypothetical protein